MVRSFFLLTLLISLHAAGQEQTAPDSSKRVIQPEISVRISPRGIRFKPGQDVTLQVEIWNESKQDLFISKQIDDFASNTLATLQLTVYKGKEPIGPFYVVAADCFCSQRQSYPPLAEELPKYWIALPPHHFYGKEVIVHTEKFAGLKPGKYRIQGTYKSLGFLASNLNNPLAHYFLELQELPYQSWVGEVETNPAWIELTSSKGKANR